MHSLFKVPKLVGDSEKTRTQVSRQLVLLTSLWEADRRPGPRRGDVTGLPVTVHTSTCCVAGDVREDCDSPKKVWHF